MNRYRLYFLGMLHVCAVLLALRCDVRAQIQEGRELVMLDRNSTIHEIHVNDMVATTITFPAPINFLAGFGMVTDPSEAKALAAAPVSVVQFENVQADTLVVRLLKVGEPIHATVRTGGNIFLLRIVPAEEAHLAVIVPPPGEQSAAVEVGPEALAADRIKFSTEELVGLLGRARQRKFLQSVNPSLYTGWEERNDLDLAVTRDGVTATIYEVQRWPEKDALVFRCWITNRSDSTFEFDPVDVRVRAAERSYPAQLVDCSGVVAAGQRVAMDVVLQGGPGGGRESVAIDNDFRIELPKEGRSPGTSAILFGDAGADMENYK